jgi:anti-sigma factor RsiW
MTAHLDDALAQSYVDGALDAGGRDACAEHLAGCEECRLVVESYRALADALEGLAVPAPGADFTRGVLARIDAHERHAAFERRVGLGIAAAAVLVAAGAFAAAGASGWAAALSGWSAALGGLFHAASIGLDVAAPLVRVLRVQILIACVALTLPLLLALRRLSVPDGGTESLSGWTS